MSKPIAADAQAVHPGVRIAAEWAWRLIVICAGLAVLGYVIHRLETVLMPVGLALLASALLVPFVDRLQVWGVPRSAAVVVVLLGALGIVAGIMTFVVEQFVEGLPQLTDQFAASVTQIQNWLTSGPFHFSEDQIRQGGDSVVKSVQPNREQLTSGALTTATVVGEIFTGALLTFFTPIFFLYGGDQIWEFVTRIIPRESRRRIRIAGAFLAGFLAVLVALVTKGFLTALIVLGIIIGVMQLEAHVLQPLLLGRAVRLHPLAVVLAITAGLVIAGIVGGLLAVPIVAVLNTAIRSLLADDPDAVYDQLHIEDPIPSDPAADDD